MNERLSKSILNIIILALVIFYMSSINVIVWAQQWTPLPPYNVLWPLWSPLLSPPDPVTGVPTPLVTLLTNETVLPVEPALVWDPSLPYFYLLYNYIPTWGSPALKYFDPTIGLYGYSNPFVSWPPNYLLTSVTTTTGTATVPSPLSLPIGYETLFSFDPILWLNFWVPRVNTVYEDYYGVNPLFQTAAQILPALYLFTSGTFALPPV